MKKILYIALALSLLCGGASWAQKVIVDPTYQATIDKFPPLLLNATLDSASVRLGAELVDGWTNNVTYPFDTWTPGTGSNITQAVTDGSGFAMAYKAVTLGAGKCFRLIATQTKASGVNVLHVLSCGAGSEGPNIEIASGTTTGAWGRAGVQTHVLLYFALGDSSDFAISNYSLKEFYLADFSSNARHLSPANAPTYSWLGATGTSARVLNFNGTTDLLDTGSDWIGTDAVTVEVWIRPETTGESTTGRIVANGRYYLFMGGAALPIGVCSNGVNVAYSANSAITLNAWNHVVATRTAAGVTNIYVNSVLSGVANQSSGTPEAGIWNAFVGANNDGTSTFDGDISELRSYTGILTAAQIRYRYNETCTQYGKARI